jgi:branched-chain amino acid transport system ATP-binding protein
VSLLELRDVEAWYAGTHALRGVTLTLEDGEFAAVVGANGAGKTTLLRAIARTIRISGEVHLEGERATRFSPAAMARRGVVHIRQGAGPFASLSVLDNLRAGAWIQRGPLDNAYARVYELLPFLYERRNAPAGTLSAGDQRLLTLGCAVMARPRLLLVDEPSAGVPPTVAREFFVALQKLHERGTAIVVAEQRAGLVLAAADRALVIDDRRVVFDGAADAVRADVSAYPALFAP